MTTSPRQTPAVAEAQARLTRLLQYLESDSGNRNLLADAAASAFEAQQFAQCDAVLARYEAQHDLPPALVNLRGLSALSQGNFAEALTAFRALRETHDAPELRYNIAYSNAMLGRFEEAISEIDDDVLDALPIAVTLKLRALHHLRRLDEAIELGERYSQRPGSAPELHAALATAYFDAENPDAARAHAAQAPDTPDALTVQGLLALDEDTSEAARALFERALAMHPNSGRAMLGAGLALLSEQRFADAASALDRAAELLQSHAGAWIAAGWAHLFGGDMSSARARFEHAAQLDRGFAEAPGGLAVVNFYEERFDEAERQAKVALRLDANSPSGAFAQSLLETHAGQGQAAADTIRAVLNRPLGTNGRTFAQAMARRTSRITRRN